jgi:hypothetical protein
LPVFDKEHEPMTWATWLYVSNSLLKADEAMSEVDRIVDVSRPRNAVLDVTGALLFTGTRFVQLLEGPAIGVSELQASIFRDVRHENIITIDNADVDVRLFSDWSLAYAGPSQLVAKTVNEAISRSEHDPEEGIALLYKLLKTFSSSG